LKEFFQNKKIQTRMRPAYFPFVEPGIEIDIKIDGSKWMEVIGAGIVHPNVLANTKINPQNWRGLAFGVGIDRLAMLKYNINDVRLFYSSDLRFLKQF